MFIDYLTNPLCDFMIHLISIHFDFLKWKKKFHSANIRLLGQSAFEWSGKNEIFAYPYIS